MEERPLIPSSGMGFVAVYTDTTQPDLVTYCRTPVLHVTPSPLFMYAVCINMVMALSFAQCHSQTEQVFPMSDVCSELLLDAHAGRS